jgi:GNAT superfamily N-acetyltransferase
MKIRPFRKSDSEEVLILIREFLDYWKTENKMAVVFNDYIPSKKKAYAKYFLKMFVEAKKSRFLVAEDEGKIFAYIVGKIENNQYEKQNPRGIINSIFVTRKSRGKKVGKTLYQNITTWFKKHRCDHLVLETMDNSKAMNMYKKWGFTPIRVQMKKKL